MPKRVFEASNLQSAIAALSSPQFIWPELYAVSAVALSKKIDELLAKQASALQQGLFAESNRAPAAAAQGSEPPLPAQTANASSLFAIPVGGRQPESAVTGIEMLDGRIIMRAQCTQEEWKEWMRKSIAENNNSSAPKGNGQ
jgi:hypothetical protein